MGRLFVARYLLEVVSVEARQSSAFLQRFRWQNDAFDFTIDNQFFVDESLKVANHHYVLANLANVSHQDQFVTWHDHASKLDIIETAKADNASILYIVDTLSLIHI